MSDETTINGFDDSLLSGSIHFTGLGSGTDFNSITDQLVDVERIHIRRLEVWKQEWSDKVDAFQELNTELLNLKTSLEGMDTPNEFLKKKAEGDADALLTAMADSEAQEGSHVIEVNRLAQNKIMTSVNSVADADTSINSSGGDQVFAYTYKGSTYSVTVSDGASLDNLKSLINSDPSNPGVRASIVSDGNASYLQMRGLDQGDDATLEIDATTTVTAFDDPVGEWETTQENWDAQIRVDGWPTGSWIESDTNTITGVIEGVTLNLKGLGSSDPMDDTNNATVNLNISTDFDSVKEQVVDFVDKVNVVRKKILDLTKFDDVTGEGSLLTGNYSLQLMGTKIKELTATSALGFNYDLDEIVSLTQVGISSIADENDPDMGLLYLDETEFDNILYNNPDALAEIFSADHKGGVDNNNFKFESYIDGVTAAGAYDIEYTMSGGDITSATINGNPATFDNTTNQITGGSGYPEAGLVIEVINMSDGDYSGEARLKQGKTGEMVDVLKNLTSETDGPLQILEENYQDIIDNIDTKIEREQDRIDAYARTLRDKFARLEATLGYYEGINQSLSSQMSSLSPS
jgi:flagellar hook-associated protein 2